MDTYLFWKIHALVGQHAWLDLFMLLLDRKYQRFVYALVLVGLWMTRRDRLQRLAATAAVVALVDVAVTEGLTLCFFRPRPWVFFHLDPLAPPRTDTSFPSGHASFAFAVGMSVFLRHRLLGLPLLVLAALISFSRVYLGNHWPSDVLAGGSLGILMAVAGVRLLDGALRPVFDGGLTFVPFRVRRSQT